VKQNFEHHPKLAAHMERLANTSLPGWSQKDWQYFTDTLNAALATREEIVEQCAVAAEQKDRIARNRDMWKGQCERQAAKLTERCWQPIATAPRDGRRILATGGGLEDGIDIVAYHVQVGAWTTTDYTLDDRDDEPEGYNRPTHWQPLPAAPGSEKTAHPATAVSPHQSKGEA
jgi:hypothetical protein